MLHLLSRFLLPAHLDKLQGPDFDLWDGEYLGLTGPPEYVHPQSSDKSTETYLLPDTKFTIFCYTKNNRS